MSEAEIRETIAQAQEGIERQKKGKGRVWKTVALTLGLGMVSACYGAPPPRPPATDGAAMQQAPAQPSAAGRGDLAKP